MICYQRRFCIYMGVAKAKKYCCLREIQIFTMILCLVSISQLIGTPCIKQTHMKLPVSLFKDQVKGEQSIRVLMQVSRHSARTAASVTLCSNLARAAGKPGNAFCSRPLHKVYTRGLRPEPWFQKAVSSTFGCSPREWDSSQKTGSESKHSPLPAVRDQLITSESGLPHL